MRALWCGLAFAGAMLWAQEGMRSVWDGVFTEAQAARGQEAYNNVCLGCHGAQLGGGEAAPPLAGGEFLSNWNGLTVGELFERIRVSMPADRPGQLPRQQNADILAYIFKVNGFPPGDKELDQRPEWLKQIRIDAAKPEKK
jgi:mono/diheme cytochrome c family protein